MNIVLASQSPRRRELLSRMGLDFSIQTPTVDEDAFTAPEPVELVKLLSREKARQVAAGLTGDTLVIAADTVVVRDGTVLGKPSSPQEAEAMLASLSGRSHLVCTGVTAARGGRAVTEAEVTRVTFRSLDREEIRRYVATGEPLDKAGAYGIQGLGALLVSGIQGDYSNVVGLPVCLLGQMLKQFGLDCLALAELKQEERL